MLSMKFFLLVNLKLLIIANFFLLNITEHENFSANKYENANYCWHFHIYLAEKISCSAEHENFFITSRPDCLDVQADVNFIGHTCYMFCHVMSLI